MPAAHATDAPGHAGEGDAHRQVRVRLPPASRPSPGGTHKPAGTTDSTRQQHSSSLPPDLWNTVVAKNTPQPHPGLASQDSGRTRPASDQPFSTISSRSYSNTLEQLFETPAGQMPGIPRSQSLTPLKRQGSLPTVQEEGSTVEPFRMETLAHHAKTTATASRSEAQLLYKAFKEMEANICDNLGGRHPHEVALEAAQDADANRVMEVLEPKIYSIDVIMNELVKQVAVGCSERGEVLEACRLHFLAMMSISAAAMDSLSTLCNSLQTQCEALEQKLGPLGDEHKHAVEKISALELQLEETRDMVGSREREVETMRRSLQKTQQSEERSRGKREIALQEKIDELDDLNGLLKSKLAVINSQLQHAESSSGHTQALVQELQERIRRDANVIDCLKEENSRQKISLNWFRCLVHIRRDKSRITKNQTTQDGPGLDHIVADNDSEAGMDGEGGGGGGERGRGFHGRKGGKGGPSKQVPFSVFWNGVVRQAEQLDLNSFKYVEYRLEKRALLERISMLYTEKIMVDELDDKLKLSRQHMPEFCYEYHLELLYDPVLAEEALVNLVANVYFYEQDSPRVRMFGRLLNLFGDAVSQDSLNMFLLGLVKVQGGSSPLIPPTDNLYIEAAKAQRAIEYVFAQSTYMFRQKMMLECEKRSVGRQIDIDSFLLFMVDMWRDEQQRVEERMRSLFVGADANADGNLDFDEFMQMVNNVKTDRPRRELLKMFSEITLMRNLDPTGFVKLCRKYKFMTFELGPSAHKRHDASAKEVFQVLNQEWRKIEDVVHELLVVLAGTRVGERIEDSVALLKTLLRERLEAEQAWLVYRKVVAEFTSAIKNRTPDALPQTDTDQEKGGKGAKGLPKTEKGHS